MSNSIQTTSFDYNYHSAQKHGNNNYGEYVRHNIDIYNKIGGFDAVYQTSGSYDYNDYSCPSPELSLSKDGGTDRVLCIIDGLCQSDIDALQNDQEAMEELIEKINNNQIKTLADIQNYYDAINENLISAKAEFESIIDNLELSNDIDDYSECEETGLLTMKEKA